MTGPSDSQTVIGPKHEIISQKIPAHLPRAGISAYTGLMSKREILTADQAIAKILRSGGDYTRIQAEKMIAAADGPDEMSTPAYNGAIYVMRVTPGRYNVER
jgi:hypothetical protein